MEHFSLAKTTRPLGVVLALIWPGMAHAHQGPPFPILEQQQLGACRVSVWSDPDVGTGTFFIILENAGACPRADLDGLSVQVAPVAPRLPEKAYRARPQSPEGDSYYAEVPFDQAEPWRVRVSTLATRGAALETVVEVTPDGIIGPIGLLIYALPFLGVGFLWLRALRRPRGVDCPSRRYRTSAPESRSVI